LMKLTSRRKILGTLGTLPFLGIASCSHSKGGARNKVDAVTGPTFIARSDKEEYARLKALDLNDPEIIAERKKMPVGKIGNLSVGRLISGSNLISMNMHARDLYYVRALAANYNTEERIFMTLFSRITILGTSDCQNTGMSGAAKCNGLPM